MNLGERVLSYAVAGVYAALVIGAPALFFYDRSRPKETLEQAQVRSVESPLRGDISFGAMDKLLYIEGMEKPIVFDISDWCRDIKAGDKVCVQFQKRAFGTQVGYAIHKNANE